MTFRRLLVPALATLTLAACGGGGGGSSSSDSTPPGTLANEAPTSPPPAQTYAGPLAVLFGELTIGWTFGGVSRDAFTARASIDSASLSDDRSRVSAGATLTADLLGQAPISGTGGLSCSLAPEGALFLCAVVTADASARTFFLFDAPAEGFAEGVFEFCDALTANDACASGLLAAPDGIALLRIEAPGTANIAARVVPGTEGDLVPHFAYADQGVPAPLKRVAPARFQLDAMVEVIEELTEAVAP